MAEKLIPVADLRYSPAIPAIPDRLEPPTGILNDTLHRPLRDLRISVTDRCNFRCVYCMPKEVFDSDYAYLPHQSLLSFEEIVRVARIFIAHGVEKIRLTGGEPLLRKNLEDLVAMLHALPTHSGQPLDLTLTTNGSLLARKAQVLKDAGLTRVTISLDALDEATFQRMNDVDFPVAEVLRGIDAAHAVGLGPIKINMVVKRGMNDQEILPMARYFKGTPHTLRFIEYMDVGSSNGWKMDEVIPSSDVIRMLDNEMPLMEVPREHGSDTAGRWRYRDGGGEIGTISSVTQAFCGSCTRARLSTEGKLYTCLFATSGHDLRALLRKGHSDEEVSAVLSHIWRARGDRYSALRTANTTNTASASPESKRVEMSYIGG